MSIIGATNLKYALIFNNFYKNIYDRDNPPTKLTDAKVLMLWNHKNNKAYTLIIILLS